MLAEWLTECARTRIIIFVLGHAAHFIHRVRNGIGISSKNINLYTAHMKGSETNGHFAIFRNRGWRMISVHIHAIGIDTPVRKNIIKCCLCSQSCIYNMHGIILNTYNILCTFDSWSWWPCNTNIYRFNIINDKIQNLYSKRLLLPGMTVRHGSAEQRQRLENKERANETVHKIYIQTYTKWQNIISKHHDFVGVKSHT